MIIFWFMLFYFIPIEGVTIDGGKMFAWDSIPSNSQINSYQGYTYLKFSGGILTLIRPLDGKTLWISPNSPNGGGTILIMQPDGNLVIYDSNNNPKWATGTDKNPNAYFVVQDDGNLVIYSSSGRPLWSSGTYSTDVMSSGTTYSPSAVVRSSQGNCYLLFNGGSLGLYRRSDNAKIWYPNVWSSGATKISMQIDGNFVMYDNSNNAKWATATDKNPGAYLKVTDDCRLVILSSSNNQLWSSQTSIPPPTPSPPVTSPPPPPTPPPPPPPPPPPSTPSTPSPPSTCKYDQLLRMSLLFYAAQRSGKAARDKVPWAIDSALNDKGPNNEDMTGGYYDAGDYVKFGFPMAYTMTVLSWGGIAYPDGYTKSNQMQNLKDAIRWGTDYLLKAHSNENSDYPNYLIAQVGDGEADHDTFVAADNMVTYRPSFAVSKSYPGSDIAGETAAALAAASILLKTDDLQYSLTLLSHAKDLYNFANNYPGKYSDSFPDLEKYYSSSNYEDELAWAALWLYKATGDSTYKNAAITIYDSSEEDFMSSTQVLGWDSKHAGVQILMAQIRGSDSDFQTVKNLCNDHIDPSKRTKRGLAMLIDPSEEDSPECNLKAGEYWGSLAPAADGAFICLLASEMTRIDSASRLKYVDFAIQQMAYIIGEQGSSQSFVVGYGSNYPRFPQHAAATCNGQSQCSIDDTSANKNIIYGAVVGGPKTMDDVYNDDRNDCATNEVALDYNAGFQSLLAGLRQKRC